MRATIALGVTLLALAALLVPADLAFARGGGGRGPGGGGRGMAGGGAGHSNFGGSAASHGAVGGNRSSGAHGNVAGHGAGARAAGAAGVGHVGTGLGANSFVRGQNIAGQHGDLNRWNAFGPGYGRPGWGLGGWGLGLGLGMGLGYGYGGYGYGGYGYGNYGYGYNDYYPYDDSAYAADDGASQEVVPTTLTADPEQPAGDPASAAKFIDQGEVDFKAGRYAAAARDWQHALVDDPRNGGVMMLMAQTLFAMGQYDDSAGATQAAMQLLPPEKWNVVVSNYAQLYGSPQDYTDQLKALEKARDAKPNSPALHFLLGFHFGYLNYPKNAVKELDKTLTLAPKDLGARKLRDLFAAKWPDAPPLPQAAVDAEAAAKAGRGGRPAGGPPPGARPFKPPAPSGE